MKIIEKNSIHYNSRPQDADIDCIVIHHTGGGTLAGCLSWFQDINSQVSAHYVLDANGDVYQCCPEEKRAWHAGNSSYKGVEDCNDYSIGIELLGDGSFYANKQIDSLVELTIGIMSRHKHITVDRIVGHENVAMPMGRKKDPGGNFPWVDYRAKVRAGLGSAEL